ncbi:MAG TPA: DMT family transporter [bacterium]|nr:DMT family transporter [bacterium]
MIWSLCALASGTFNALWTSRIKGRVQTEGALPFAASVRWGVVILLLPLAFVSAGPLPARWWAFTALAGLLESLNVWTLARGSRRDYYSTYALANTAPFFTVLLAVPFLGERVTPWLVAGILLVVAGAVWLYYRDHWSWWGLAAALAGTVGNLFSKSVIGLGSPFSHAAFCFASGACLTTALSVQQGPSGSFSRLGKNIWTNRDLAFFSFLGTVTFYLALFHIPVSRVSPLFRVSMVVAFFLSVFHLKERRDWKGRGVGAILLLLGLLLVLKG